MKLGNILERRGGTPLTGHRVKFHLLTRDADGQRLIEQVEVMLFPVDTKAQAESAAEGQAWALETDEKGQRLNPDADPVVEGLWRWLLRAMRDPEAPAQAWATVNDLPKLRTGLVQEQVGFLRTQYQHMLKLHYPELCSDDELREMRGEATATFKSGQP